MARERELTAALRERYGFREAAVVERLDGGYANDVFRVRGDGADLVLHVKHPPVVEADVAWEHGLVALLAERLPEVQAPLPTTTGATAFPVEDRLAWLTPFLDGAPADPAREAHRTAAARALGRLHAAGEGLELPPRPRLEPLERMPWPDPAVPPELEDGAPEIAEGRAWAIAFVAEVAATRRPRATLVHGDFFPGNLLLASDEVTGVVDWEEAQADWAVWDLANAVSTFCARGDDLDREACARFAAAYRAAGGTAPAEEEDLVVPLVRVKRILEVLRAPTDRHPRWEHQKANLRSLRNLRRWDSTSTTSRPAS
jgi:Ser/Thr protein kinase RdoA (MazF antagonist)